jgi:hypothetical protein
MSSDGLLRRCAEDVVLQCRSVPCRPAVVRTGHVSDAPTESSMTASLLQHETSSRRFTFTPFEPSSSHESCKCPPTKRPTSGPTTWHGELTHERTKLVETGAFLAASAAVTRTRCESPPNTRSNIRQRARKPGSRPACRSYRWRTDSMYEAPLRTRTFPKRCGPTVLCCRRIRRAANRSLPIRLSAEPSSLDRRGV